VSILLGSTLILSSSVNAQINSNFLNSKILPTIPVDSQPIGIAVNPNNNKIYVANAGSDSVSVIDGLSTRLLTKVSVGDNPIDIAVNPSTNKVYVTNVLSNTVSVIDGKSNMNSETIKVEKRPVGVIVNHKDNKVYVTNSGTNTLSVIDGKTNSVISSFKTGKNPQLLTLHPIGFGVVPIILVTNYDSNEVSIIFPSLKLSTSFKENSESIPDNLDIIKIINEDVNKFIIEKVGKIMPSLPIR
jgi:YVTN family beta-propeller protein